MKKTYYTRGSITVFLCLISVLFLSLLCTSVESARIQGARALAAAALDMGNFSLFGEYEDHLLDEYDLFALDGACGTGYYNTAALEWKLGEYMQYNTAPNTGLFIQGFDPFKVQLDTVKVKGVALLSDDQGEAFYQQAVGFMHDNFAVEAVDLWMKRKEQAETLQKAATDYQTQENQNSQTLTDLKNRQKEEEKRIKEEQEKARKEAEELGITWVEEPKPEKKETKNPLETIKQIKRMGILGLALGENPNVSDKEIGHDVVSKRHNHQGSLPIKKQYSGMAADLLFQEYLFERFSRYGKELENRALSYELEYILYGKNTDEKNLKEAIKAVLLLREGANFLYLCNDLTRKEEADALAALLVGAIPIPGLTVVLSYALLLVWAYAESILDLRIMMSGGKVPVWKDGESWHMDLTDIPEILEILNRGVKGSSKDGLTYEGYLQILFTLGRKGKYPIRALDMVEKHMKASGNPGFRADQAIVKMETKASYTIPPVFLRVTDAFMGTGTFTAHYQASGTFAY